MPLDGDPTRDLFHMRHALRLARRAAARGEVPVAAVAVLGERVIAAASNRVERAQGATEHAEMVVLRLASRRVGSWRLSGVTVFVTLEPCPMCAGALLLSRVDRVVYGADDPRKGAFRSAYEVLGSEAGNHHPLVTAGLLAPASSALLQRFFKDIRERPQGKSNCTPSRFADHQAVSSAGEVQGV